MATVHFPTAELTDAVDAVTAAIEQHRKDTFEILGVQLLQFIQLAYIDKSHGHLAEDGISWEPIQVATILGRLRKAGHIETHRHKFDQRQTYHKVVRTVKRNAELFAELEAAGVEIRDKKGKRVSAAKRHRAGNVLHVDAETRKAKVTVSPGAYQIGIDTGLQFNSASPGFAGPDGKGGNVFLQDEISFTVGFGRNYSKYFDRHRKLIPEVLPEAWQEKLEELAAERSAKIIESTLREKGVS